MHLRSKSALGGYSSTAFFPEDPPQDPALDLSTITTPTRHGPIAPSPPIHTKRKVHPKCPCSFLHCFFTRTKKAAQIAIHRTKRASQASLCFFGRKPSQLNDPASRTGEMLHNVKDLPDGNDSSPFGSTSSRRVLSAKPTPPRLPRSFLRNRSESERVSEDGTMPWDYRDNWA